MTKRNLMLGRFPWSPGPAWSLATFVLALAAMTGRADDPAAKPCTQQELDKAKLALQQAKDKIAALDKLKPPGNKFTKNYEDDKRAADDAVTSAERKVKEEEKSLTDAQKALENLQTTLGAKYAGQPLSEINAAMQKNSDQLTEQKKKLDEAVAMRGKFANDPNIANQAKLLGTEKQDLADQMTQYMGADKKDDVLARLDDPNQRNALDLMLGDNSYKQLEFTPLTPDGDVLGHAQRLADTYTTFKDNQSSVVRQKLVDAMKDARDNKAGAVDQVRQLGSQLVQEIERCRKPVEDAYKKVTKQQDAIKAREAEIDPAGEELVRQIPDLTSAIKKLEAERESLQAQFSLVKVARDVESTQKALQAAQQALADAKKAAQAADKALADYLAYNTKLEPLVKQQKDAEAEVARLQQQVDDETKAKDAVLAKAMSDYDANEDALHAFRDQVTKDKADIDKQRATDPGGAATALKALRDRVTAKKKEAIKTVEGIKAALDPYRPCFKDVDDYVENTIKPKILALGGQAGAGLGVSDTEDPLSALLDVPVDKREIWVRSDPVIRTSADGRKPPGLENVSPTGLGFKTKVDGKDYSNTLTWSDPPATLYRGRLVTLKMDASSEPWANVGGWWNIKCAERGSLKGDPGAGSDKNFRANNPHSGTCTFKFAPDFAEDAYIQFSGGHDPNPNQWMLVTWRYTKQK